MTRPALRQIWRLALAPLLLCAAGTVLAQPSSAPATTTATTSTSSNVADLPAELKKLLPQAKLIGKARLKVWGFEVYDARLWAPTSFNSVRFATFPLALELAYLRDFKAQDIAERSLKEMRRTQPIGDAQAAQWTAEMLRVFPDVRKGDRITGINRPGEGAAFWVNGQASGEIRDAEFSRLFLASGCRPKPRS